MSTFICTISSQQPEVPVVSPVSGKIFEKRIIVKYIQENGVDPVNGENLEVEQLIELKPDQDARNVQSSLATASIPSLLKQLQDEWDATMLSNFALRQELKDAREELTHALFQNDSACRVINRLSSELQQARQIIATLPYARKSESDNEVTDVEMQQTETEGLDGISENLVNFFAEKCQEYSTARKQRGKSLPENLATVDDIQKYVEIKNQDALHSASIPDITCLDMQKNLILTGGLDKSVILFNFQNDTIENVFKGHQKRITSVRLHPNLKTIVSGAQDAQIRIWSTNESNARNVIGVHHNAITDVSLHPTGDHALCTSEDSHWSLIDLNVGRPIIKVLSGEDDISLTCGQFHPDGIIFGTGAKSSIVKIWDIKEQVNVAQFPGHKDAVCAISFSENGYYLATGSLDGEIKIWDLRKLENLKTFALHNSKHAVNALTFDKSGAYLAVAGENVEIFKVKSWNKIAHFDGHTKMVTGVRFGEDVKFIASASLDKTVRIYALPEQ